MRRVRGKTRTSEIELREELNALERDWLVCRLVAQNGVRDAACRVSNPRRVIVEYDATLVNIEQLVNFIQHWGLTSAMRLVQP